MYEIITRFSEFQGETFGFISLVIGYLLATALFVLLVNPLHNFLQALVIRSNGDYWVEEAGYLTMSPYLSFNWIGCVSALVVQMGFSDRIQYRRSYLKSPFFSTLWISLTGIFTYAGCSLMILLPYTILTRLGLFGISSAVNLPENGLAFGVYAYHAAISAIYYLIRICLYSALFNLIPLVPMDMGELLFVFIRKHWGNSLKNNENFIAAGVFILAFFVIGTPDSVIVETATVVLNSVANSYLFVIDIISKLSS